MDFIRAIVARHQAEGTYGGRVETRFPPEPNGFLHIGHAKSIVLNFGLAEEYGGVCHLRFDDTNPLTEDMRYVRSIQEDVRWLGYDWGEHLYFASDYFERLYECALILIRKGKAYVDSLSEEEIRQLRGTVTEPGQNSPYRDRPVEENLDLFRRMREGEFEDGAHVLRAKIDMAHPNMIMRDPVLYRIRHATHYRRGDEWCIYPLYDFTHCLSDAFENITHSLCTLEFDNNREIYDWILTEVGFEEPRPHQYEFARLNLDYTVLSKRRLLRLVDEGHVDGWDDPRMPTLAGMRRRGIPPEAIRTFCEMIGVAKADNRVDMGKLEYAVRDHLNRVAPRVMAVLRPLKVVLTNFPENRVEWLEIPSFPDEVSSGGGRTRKVPFSRELYIESDDFLEQPPPDFYRLAPGREVRLRFAYFIRCEEVLRDPSTGEVKELRCTYDPATRGGSAPDGRKVRGTLHWVSATEGLPCEVRLYDRLFLVPDPEGVGGRDFTEFLNPESLRVVRSAWVEPSVRTDPPGTRYQFERLGYFASDPFDSREDALVFNRIVTLRDTWAKRQRDRAAAGRIPTAEPGPMETRETGGGLRAAGAGAEGGSSRAPVSAPTRPQESEPAPTPKTRRSRRNAARENRERARRKYPELRERFLRYQQAWGLSDEDADLLTGSRELSDFFEACLAEAAAPVREDDRRAEGEAPALAQALAHWIVNELLRELKQRRLSDLAVTPERMVALVRMLEGGVVSQPTAKDLFQAMVERGVDPRDQVREQGLTRVSDRASLAPFVEEVLHAHPDKVLAFREGRRGLLGFFMGHLMRQTQGRGDPVLLKEMLLEALEGDENA